MNLTIDITHHVSEQEKHQIEVAELLITSDPDGASAREDRSTILSSIVVSNHQDHNFVSRRVCIVHRPQDHAEDLFFSPSKTKGKQKTGGVILDTRTKGSP